MFRKKGMKQIVGMASIVFSLAPLLQAGLSEPLTVQAKTHDSFEQLEAPLNGWQKFSDHWYYLNEAGEITTGWQKINQKWYFLDSIGAMQTGWLKSGKIWYYLDLSGAMATGWRKVSGAWYYFNSTGVMQTGWQNIGGTWYYFRTSGSMVTGWQKIGAVWYYFNADGAMQTGWQEIAGQWYYFNDSGVMQTGRVKIGATWYTFADSGAWLPNELQPSVPDEEQLSKPSLPASPSSNDVQVAGKFNLQLIQQEFTKMLNEERQRAGVNTLRYRTDFQSAVNTRAFEIRGNGGSFSHTRPNGTNFRTVYSQWNWYNSEENLVWFEIVDQPYSEKEVARQMFEILKASPVHFPIMMGRAYTHLTMGVHLDVNHHLGTYGTGYSTIRFNGAIVYYVDR